MGAITLPVTRPGNLKLDLELELDHSGPGHYY